MAYTPELTAQHSATLRRIAWALQMPMTKAIGEVFDYLGGHSGPDKSLFSLPGPIPVYHLSV